MQETVGGVWKKEEELKALKAEVAALERKIQLTLAPPKPEAGQEQTDGMEQENGKCEQLPETVKPDTSDDFIHNHVFVVRSGISDESKMQSRGMKI